MAALVDCHCCAEFHIRAAEPYNIRSIVEAKAPWRCSHPRASSVAYGFDFPFGQEDHFAGQDMLGWGIRTEAVPYIDPTRTHSNPGRYARQYHRISHSPSQVGAVISLRLRYSTLNIKDYKPNQAGTRTRVLPPPGGVSCPQWAQAISLPGGAGSWRL